MDVRHVRSAEHARQQIDAGAHDRIAFREALLAVPGHERDGWIDRVLGLDALPDDGPELPRGGVPYMPCEIGVLLEIIERAAIGPDDVFVDIGAGIGRAMAIVHLLTGARAVGIEIQSALVQLAREVTRPFAGHVEHVLGDAAQLTGRAAQGTVYFAYCPFSDERLHQLLAQLEGIASERPIRVACVDMSLPACAWLTVDAAGSAADRVSIFRGAR